jgi:hypothetical protein
MNTRIKRSGAVLVVLAITAIGITSWCLWRCSSGDAHDFVISTVGDAEEASGVVAAIKEHFLFGDGNAAPPLTTGAKSTPKEPTIYIRPGATGRGVEVREERMATVPGTNRAEKSARAESCVQEFVPYASAASRSSRNCWARSANW